MTGRRQVNGGDCYLLLLPARNLVSMLWSFAPGIGSETQPLQDTRNLYKEEVQVYELTGGVELVPLLTCRRYQSHPQTTRYLVTDATRPGYTIES